MDVQIKVISNNKKASYDYFLESRIETGIALVGTEIKSIRAGKVNLVDSYVQIRNNEAYVINLHISEYEKGSNFNHDPRRTRKLLLKKHEILKLSSKINEKGYTLIPTKLYLKGQHAKLEIALAKGKKNYDKRESEKEKTVKRDIRKAFKEHNN